MFKKDINFENRDEMISFLTNHFRYYTMNSWNRMTSYANNVKLQNIDIPPELRDKAYDFISASCEDYNIDIHDLIAEFQNETGYTAGFNGRSDGYIVMYETEKRDGRTYTLARGIDEYEDFEDYHTTDIKARVKLIQRFDELCDKIRETFLWYVENATIENAEIVHTETIKVAHIS